MNLTQVLNGYLDKLPRLDVRIGRYSWHAFKVCGYTGLILAIALALTLTTMLGLSTLVMVGIIASAICTFFGVILVTRLITGEELIVYYHHEIAVIAAAGLLVWLLGEPVLPYVDITILGIGTFLTCGRVGCLMVGCCHGVPNSWGVRYRAEHAASILSPNYAGVRLFPIQAIESLYVLGVVIVGCRLALGSQPPGEAFGWYTVSYSLGRFCFEFRRGDLDRPYYWAFSEAQWISLLLMGALLWAELTSTISFHLWHFGVTGLMVVMVIAVALRSLPKGITKHRLFHPYHLHEFAGAVKLACDLAVDRCDICKQVPATQDIHIASTYLGIQVSASRLKRMSGQIHHYSLCDQKGIMSEEAATALTRALLQIRHPVDSSELVKGTKHVFHLLVHTPPNSVALRGVVDELIDGAESGNRTSSPYRRSEETPVGRMHDVRRQLHELLLIGGRNPER